MATTRNARSQALAAAQPRDGGPALLRALYAEALKVRRTLALALAFVAPAVMAFLETAILWQRGSNMVRGDVSPWAMLTRQTLTLWGLLMLPLFVTLETALISGVEHGQDHWRHLFALPIPRWTVYAAKQIAGLALIGLSMLALVVLTILAGLGLRFLLPGFGFEQSIPWRALVRNAALCYLGSWLIIAIHTWVGLNWRNFAVAMGVGIAMTVMGVLLISSDYAPYYPWALPALMAQGFVDGQNSWRQLALGSLGGIITAVVGGYAFVRRDVL